MDQANNDSKKTHCFSQATVNAMWAARLAPMRVQAVHKASTFQEEMVVATIADSKHQVNVEVQHFTCRERLNVAHLNSAAHALARRHVVLRSLFCWNDHATKQHPGRILMLVLGTDYPEANIKLVSEGPTQDMNTENPPIDFHVLGLSDAAEIRQWHGEMPWRLTIDSLPGQKNSRLSLCYHTAILDESSACRMLRYLWDELQAPGSTVVSDFIAAHKGLAFRRSHDMQRRVQEKLAGAPPLLTVFGSTKPLYREGYGVTIDKMAMLNPRADRLLRARQALYMALCTLARTQEATFLELIPLRELLPSNHREVLGPILVPQIRWIQHDSRTLLSRIAESLSSGCDIHHAFSPGELCSFSPNTAYRPSVSLICHIESCASTGVEAWTWDGKDSWSDVPLVIELIPCGGDLYLVRISYHRDLFTDNAIAAFRHFFCASLEWQQHGHDTWKDITLESAVHDLLSSRPDAAVHLENQKKIQTNSEHVGESPGTIMFSNTSPITTEKCTGHTCSSLSNVRAEGGACAHHLLERSASRFPEKIALQYEISDYLTYKDLNDRCDLVAVSLTCWIERIQRTSPGEDLIIPISFDKGFELVIAMFSVLKAGAAFVHIDASLPASRIAGIIRKAGAPFILYDGKADTHKLNEVARREGRAIVALNDLVRMQNKRPLPSNRKKQPASSLAYIQVTSGTTGEPKCIMIEHCNLVAFMEADEPEFLGGWTTSKLQLSNRTFDIAMADIFGTLGRGGRLVFGPDAELLSSLARWLEMTSVTDLNTSPLVADLLKDHVPAYLSVLMVGGEPFHPSLIKGIPKECRLYNNYGPSETTFVATTYTVSEEDENKSNVPIGRSFGSCSVHILAPESTERVKSGDIGEICISGSQVSRGYLGQPELTGKSFVSDPSAKDEKCKLYRTGDLGRLLPDGRLEYTGRKDKQVKLRGQRVETLEIEMVIRKHPRVKACAVATGDSSHGMALVAFIETQPNHQNLFTDATAEAGLWASLVDEIKTVLSQSLPDYMIPARIVKLDDGLPRLPSNKLDQKALSARATEVLASEASQAALEYVHPRDEVERHVCEAFSNVFSCQVGITNSFLDLGGHSVTAIRVASKIRKHLRTVITFRDVLECLTPETLSARIRASAENIPQSLPTYRAPDSMTVEQSFAQGRLWFLEQLHPNLSWYHMPLAFRLRGRLHLDALGSALLALEERHETLRTTFEVKGDMNVQVVHPFTLKGIRILDLTGDPGHERLYSVLRSEQTKAFNLTNEPGWRVAVVRVSSQEHVLSLVIHHIIADGWSLGVVLRELALFYSESLRGKDSSLILPPLPIQYRAYSLWQRQEEQLRQQQRHLAYWTQQLRGSHPAEFPCDKPRPAVPSGQAAVRGIKLGGVLYRDLGSLCKRYSTTPFVVLLAAFRAAHYRMTGAADTTIGTPFTNRNREEHEGIIGLFVNMQCMRVEISESDSFEVLVQRVKETAAAAYEHNEVPFEMIVSELHPTRDSSRNPLIQTIFAFHPERVDKISLEGIDSELISLTHATRFDLEFHVCQCEDGLEGDIVFSTELFHGRTIEVLLSIFQDILRVGLENSHTAIETIPLPSATSALDDMNLLGIRRSEYPRTSSIVDVFREQVAAHPGKTAVKDNQNQWSYARLDLESDKMAGWLRDLKMPKETVITVFANRSCETIAAFLGILKANMAYLPLDIKFPAARIESILSFIEGNRVVLVGSGCELPITHLDRVDVVPMARLSSGIGQSPAYVDNTMPTAKSLAYVMFTSGSTGQPKGVMIEHRAVVSRVKGCDMLKEEVAAKPFAHISSIAFDAAVWEIYTPLLNGGTVICIDSMTITDFEAFSNIFHAEGIEIALITPALLKQLLTEPSASISELHTLVVGGDRADPQDMIKARKLVQYDVVNAYGPTENTVISTFYRLPESGGYHNGVPIGQAVTNSKAYVVDRQLCLVPPGVIGELVVVGDGLARGYTDTRRDVNRFLNIDIRGQVLRAYRTGDRVRRRPVDGQLEYIGRLDGQVKIRGFRVETEEIEHVLHSSGLVGSAAVLFQQPDNQEGRLVAFVTLLKGGYKHLPMDEVARGIEEQESEQAWKQIFSEVTYDSQIDPREAEEMGEWLDDTITTLLNGAPPGNVVEIGTGSGMILFNIANDLQTYVGLEPVQSIVEFVKTIMDKTNPTLASKVQLHVGSASDLDKISPNISRPDLVVVNSVAQYFPSAEYLSRLILDLLRKHQAKTLFFGDIRSYALYAQFQVTKALHGEGEISLEYICQSMADTVENETELLIDPAFFTSLAAEFTDLIHHVEILPKRMRATNELSCYRYSAIIHAVRQDYLPIIHTVDADQWIDYSTQGLSRNGLLDLLKEGSESAVVAIANIPHSKTIFERLVVEAFSSQTTMTDIGWLPSIRQNAAEVDGLSAKDLVDLGTLAGFHVELSWARQFSQHGGLDAIFHRIKSQNGRQRTIFQFCTDHEGRSIEEFSNRPMQVQPTRQIIRELQQFLKIRVPWYMVPALISVLEDMPTNHSGKIDRQALSQIAATMAPRQAPADMTFVHPRTKFEVIVCEAFGHVLGCEMGVTENFFDLGGHSLMATRAISKIVERTQCAITVRDLFDYPTPGALASRISTICDESSGEEAESDEIQGINEFAGYEPVVHDEWNQAVEAAGICAADVVHMFPCSPFQEGVLAADLVLRDSPAYLATMKLRFDGRLDVDMLQSAWHSVVAREEMLRTAFMPSTQDLSLSGMCSGAFLQAVLRYDSNEVERVSTLRQQEYNPLPDLGIGHIPVSLALRQNDVTGLMQPELTMHHALYDEAYLSYILEGLSRDYHHAQSHSPTNDDRSSHMPFITFIRTLQQKDRSVGSTFWKKYLDGAPACTWPITCGLRGPMDGVRIPHEVRAEWSGDAEALSRIYSTTPAGLVRAALALSIAVHSDSDDVIFGEVSSGRAHSEFVKGPCIATHPVRIPLAVNSKQHSSDGPRKGVSVEELLTRTRDAYLDTMPYQHFGLESIRRLTENPDLLPFQVLFVFQAQVTNAKNHIFPWSRFSIADGELKRTDFPLVLEVFCRELTGHLQMRCVFDPAAILPADADWVLQHIIDSIDLMQKRYMQHQEEQPPEAKLVIKERERTIIEQLLGHQDGESSEGGGALSTVIQLFHKCAVEMPEKIALQVQRSDFVTFGQLDDLSNHIAVGLEKILNSQTSATAKQRYVPIFFEKSYHMVGAILGILKAGAAVVPMDIEHPMQRLETICVTSAATVFLWDGIIGGEKLQRLAKSTGATALTVDDLLQNTSQTYKHKVLPLDSLAYVLFTSGSTGIPKGVMIDHRNLASFLSSNRGSTDCSWTSNRLALLAPTFDAAMGDLFATLCKGGRLLLGKQQDILSGLSHCLKDLSVTHLSLTPTLGTLILNDLDNEGFSFLRSLVFGGEPFPLSTLSRVPRTINVWNGYGPTEATIEIAACEVQGPVVDVCGGRSFVPIGEPGQNRHIRVLYPGTTEEVPLGSVGEVCISGQQVAQGYLGEADLTAAYFIPNPFSPTGQGRMYRTGDRARLHGDGYLEYLGRMDGQIKVRGIRIDTDEICSVAQEHPQIIACAVTKLESNGTETLTAFVEAVHPVQPGNVICESIIKEHLAQSLPTYMVPAFIWVQTTPLPRTTSGKLDRIAITKMAADRHNENLEDRSRHSHTPVRAAPGSLEDKIASLWAKVLGINEDSVDITATFHKMGGDSIRAIALLAILRRQELHLDLIDVSQTSTVQSQAARVRQGSAAKNNASYLHFHMRQGSMATIVLVHPFLAQCMVFEPLLPLLDGSIDVLLVDDPFMGTANYPETLSQWANHCLTDMKEHIQTDHPVIFGGYSFGGFIAFEMAHKWDQLYGAHSSSVVLLDPGTYEVDNRVWKGESEKESLIMSSLGRSEVSPQDILPLRKCFDGYVRALEHSKSPPVYEGKCLHVALPDRLQDGVVDWWKAHCTNITLGVVDCDNHYALMKDAGCVAGISQFINEHCNAVIEENRAVSSASSESRMYGGSSRTDVSMEDGDVKEQTSHYPRLIAHIRNSYRKGHPINTQLHKNGPIPLDPQPGTKLRVIGAGLWRTGTASFSAALAILLNGPVHHGGTQTNIGPPDEITTWMKVMRLILNDNAPDRQQALTLIDRQLEGYAAVTDAPGTQLVPELMEVYPTPRSSAPFATR
ncbi:nonribosomal peptide synthase [Aspergillus vadensis CBS 113365]|uniref:Nonribosomal peptide synthase n=1 Tax=Aspergillus vadensis (strain CBS 113365 / IMI 142717 / IBT 24658) TaxID=1448311 RepID=A0A319BG32_ASPVC|nr:nonribosomal peptide synthase [Aspergillus vadensis CBS 113365]PYH71029.1 nonribosomal peptide synthase [Aspergillus vadensis CBS 113365]